MTRRAGDGLSAIWQLVDVKHLDDAQLCNVS